MYGNCTVRVFTPVGSLYVKGPSMGFTTPH